MSLLALPSSFNAVVLGSTGTIGQEFVRQLQAHPQCGAVFAFSRQSSPTLELVSEASVSACAQAVASSLNGGALHLLVDATGALNPPGGKPEKRLADVTPEQFAHILAVNVTGRALVLKHFLPLMAKQDKAVVAALSARVGSISDNHLGGWYSYRAAKTAGNMLFQTAAVEAYRTRKNLSFVLLQPGTVLSNLSRPFAAGHEQTPVEVSVQGMLETLTQAPADGKAHFLDFRGQPIPW